MFILSWNVAGWSTTTSAIRESYGSLANFLELTHADILCLQESKISREKLVKDPVAAGAADPVKAPRGTTAPPPVSFSTPFRIPLASFEEVWRSTETSSPSSGNQGGGVPGWESYWAHSAKRLRGMNGVATFVKSGRTLACDNRPFEEEDLNDEGRCVVTYHSSCIVVNVYVPNARGGTRMAQKLQFLGALQRLMERLRRGEQRRPPDLVAASPPQDEQENTNGSEMPVPWAMGKPVILVGDFNITYMPGDGAWWFRRIELRRLLEIQLALLHGCSEADEGGDPQHSAYSPLTKASVTYFCACVAHFLSHHVAAAIQLAEQLAEVPKEANHTDSMEGNACTGPRKQMPFAEDRPLPPNARRVPWSSSIAVDASPALALPLVDPEALRLDLLRELQSTLAAHQYLEQHRDTVLPFPPLVKGGDATSRDGTDRPLFDFPELPRELHTLVTLEKLVAAGFVSVQCSEFLQGNTSSTGTFNPFDTPWNKEVVYAMVQYAGLPPHADETIHFMAALLQRSVRAATASPPSWRKAPESPKDRMWDSFWVTEADQQAAGTANDNALPLATPPSAPCSACCSSAQRPYCPCPFTCWDQQRNRRHSNEGTRLDYILVDQALMPLLVCREETENNTGPLVTEGPPLTEMLSFHRRFFAEYFGGFARADGIRRAVAAGAYPPAPYDGSGLPPLQQNAREWMWRGLPSTGLWITPPQFSDHIGVAALFRQQHRLQRDGTTETLTFTLEPRATPVAKDFHPPCAYLPPRKLFSFMTPATRTPSVVVSECSGGAPPPSATVRRAGQAASTASVSNPPTLISFFTAPPKPKRPRESEEKRTPTTRAPAPVEVVTIVDVSDSDEENRS